MSEQKIIIAKEGDSQKVKELEAEIERLKTEAESAKEEAESHRQKLELIAQKEFERKKQEVGAPDSIDTPEKLQGFILARQSQVKTKKSGVERGAGVVPLASQYSQSGVPWTKKKYSNDKEGMRQMISDLKSVAKNQELSAEERATAQAILDNLLLKAVAKGSEGEREIKLREKD
jgi:hypothetical protein